MPAVVPRRKHKLKGTQTTMRTEKIEVEHVGWRGREGGKERGREIEKMERRHLGTVSPCATGRTRSSQKHLLQVRLDFLCKQNRVDPERMGKKKEIKREKARTQENQPASMTVNPAHSHSKNNNIFASQFLAWVEESHLSGLQQWGEDQDCITQRCVSDRATHQAVSDLRFILPGVPRGGLISVLRRAKRTAEPFPRSKQKLTQAPEKEGTRVNEKTSVFNPSSRVT